MTSAREHSKISEICWRIFEDKRLLFAAWLAIIIQCFAAIYLLRPWVTGDAFHFLELARNLSSGRYGTVTQAGFEPDVLRPPAYPILLWLQLFVLGLPLVAVIVLQLVGYCALIHSAERFLAKRGINPVIFVLIAAIYPFPLLYSVRLFADCWTIIAVTAGVMVLTHRSIRSYLLAGTIAAIAGLFRAEFVLLALLFSAIVLVRELRLALRFRKALALALLPTAAACAVLAPYAAWNYVNFGRPVPVPLAGALGTSLYLATWQQQLSWDDAQQIMAGRTSRHVEQIGLGPAVRELNRQIGAPENILAFDAHAYPTDKMRIAVGQVFLRAGLKRVASDPAAYAVQVSQNSWALWVTKRYPGVPASAELVLFVSSWIVFLLGMAGICVAVFRPSLSLIPPSMAFVALYSAAIHLWLHTEARYTAPSRVLLMMFAVAFLSLLLGRRGSEPRDQLVQHPARTG